MQERAGFRERLIRLIAGDTLEEAVRQAVKEASHRAFADGMKEGIQWAGDDEPPMFTSDGKPISRGYRSTVHAPRDLSSISQERAIEAAYRLWNTNPLAKAITEIIVDYVLGDGITISAKNDEVAEALDAFWNDPVNDLDGELAESIVRELSLFGEQLFIAYVRDGEQLGMKGDGRLRLAPVDPSQIAAIITNPKNRRDVIAIRLKGETGSLDNGPIYKLIRSEGKDGPLQGYKDLEAWRMISEDSGNDRLSEAERRQLHARLNRRLKKGQEWRFVEADDGTGRAQLQKAEKVLEGQEYKGECFLFQVNKLSTGIRGRPDLLPMIDWLDRYDQLFFDGAEHVEALKRFVWDVTVEGGSETASDPELNLSVHAARVGRARATSVYAHNERVKLNAVNPSLHTPELQTLIRALRIFIAGGMRIPEHWLAEGGYTNRATAAEMGEPTFKMLSRRQKFVQNMFKQICQYQIDVLVALGLLPEEVEVPGSSDDVEMVKARDAFEVSMSHISSKDMLRVSQAFMNVVNVVLRLFMAKMITMDKAIELIAAIVKMFGVEIDMEKTLAYHEKEEMEANALKDLLDELGQEEPETEEEAETEGQESKQEAA